MKTERNFARTNLDRKCCHWFLKSSQFPVVEHFEQAKSPGTTTQFETERTRKVETDRDLYWYELDPKSWSNFYNKELWSTSKIRRTECCSLVEILWFRWLDQQAVDLDRSNCRFVKVLEKLNWTNEKNLPKICRRSTRRNEKRFQLQRTSSKWEKSFSRKSKFPFPVDRCRSSKRKTFRWICEEFFLERSFFPVSTEKILDEKRFGQKIRKSIGHFLAANRLEWNYKRPAECAVSSKKKRHFSTMPLSSALQARLIQRGILNSSKTNAANGSTRQNFSELFTFTRKSSLSDRKRVSRRRRRTTRRSFRWKLRRTWWSSACGHRSEKCSTFVCSSNFPRENLPFFFRPKSITTMFKLNSKSVWNARTNGIRITLVLNIVKNGEKSTFVFGEQFHKLSFV